MKSVLITGDRSGAGKTSITLGLTATLAKKSAVQTYKAAMDYIDTSYLAGVSNRPAYNLDTFVQTANQTKGLFSFGAQGAEFGIVEGVRGLYEGFDAFSDTGSTAAIAKLLDLPIILVLNAQSITRSAAAIVRGFQVFDPEVKIAGVILNNTGTNRHVQKATDAIEYYCKVPVLGAVPRNPDMELSMRHLGLTPFREGLGDAEFHRRIENIASHVAEHVNFDAVNDVAKEVTPVENDIAKELAKRPPANKRIGIAYDEAFNFYYGELAAFLSSRGCEVKYFSPVHDSLPDCDGYIIGGGYPELFAEKLAENASMREDIYSAVKQGTPVYAECGGLMYLCSSLEVEGGWRNSPGGKFEMCKVFDGKAVMPQRKVLGYVEGRADFGGEPILFRGHEFHYSGVELKNAKYAYALSRGAGMKNGADCAVVNGCAASYTHLMPIASGKILEKVLGIQEEQE